MFFWQGRLGLANMRLFVFEVGVWLPRYVLSAEAAAGYVPPIHLNPPVTSTVPIATI